MLASGMPGSGTTTVLSNLALSAAAGGLKVVVVDANFRKPNVSSVFDLDIDGKLGLGDLLGGSVEFDQAITSSHGVDVIGPGTPASRVYERFNDATFSSVMAELRSRYDCILIDTAPAVAAGDAMILAKQSRFRLSRRSGRPGTTRLDPRPIGRPVR